MGHELKFSILITSELFDDSLTSRAAKVFYGVTQCTTRTTHLYKTLN